MPAVQRPLGGLCDGQLLIISEYPDLFGVIGTTYGGDGVTNFTLPDLRGRVPVHSGTGTGLSQRSLGDAIGAETVSLDETELPAHNHSMFVAGALANNNNRAAGDSIGSAEIYVNSDPGFAPSQPTIALNASTIENTGSGGHENMQPSLCVNYIISVESV